MHPTINHKHHDGMSKKKKCERGGRKNKIEKMKGAGLNSHYGNGRTYEVYAVGAMISRRSNKILTKEKEYAAGQGRERKRKQK